MGSIRASTEANERHELLKRLLAGLAGQLESAPVHSAEGWRTYVCGPILGFYGSLALAEERRSDVAIGPRLLAGVLVCALSLARTRHPGSLSAIPSEEEDTVSIEASANGQDGGPMQPRREAELGAPQQQQTFYLRFGRPLLVAASKTCFVELFEGMVEANTMDAFLNPRTALRAVLESWSTHAPSEFGLGHERERRALCNLSHEAAVGTLRVILGGFDAHEIFGVRPHMPIYELAMGTLGASTMTHRALQAVAGALLERSQDNNVMLKQYLQTCQGQSTTLRSRPLGNTARLYDICADTALMALDVALETNSERVSTHNGVLSCDAQDNSMLLQRFCVREHIVYR